MNDTENTTQNQEQNQEETTIQPNNGFEVLSNDNGNSTDRKDENEGNQQDAPKSEDTTEQQVEISENKPETETQEATHVEEDTENTTTQNEDLPQSENKEQAQAQEENSPVHGHSQKADSPVHQADEQKEDAHDEQKNEEPAQQDAEETKEQSPQSKPEQETTQQAHSRSESPKQQPPKEKREIFVPNYTAQIGEEEEKKSPQAQTTQSPQQGGQQAQAQQFQQYQQLLYQQFAAQQAAYKQKLEQQGGNQGDAQQGGNQGGVPPFQGGYPQQFFNPQFLNQGQLPFGQMPFLPMQQPVFLPIVDVCGEYQKGNFLPGIHCLYYNLVPKDYIDPTGYNIFHHAISYNNVEVVIALLDHLKLDIHLRSKTNQTCVMIASNFGFNEMLKVLLDRGARLDEQDDTRFTALLYCIKQGHISTFLYLLSRGANYNLTDVNGCSVVHWAAYKNNVFLLRLFRRMGLEMNQCDLAGLTPLQRAISSDAVHAVKYLVEDLKVPLTTNLQPDTITNLAIRKIIVDNTPGSKKGFWEEKKKELWGVFEKNSQLYTFGFYLLNLVVAFLCYSGGAVAENELNYVYHIIFFVFTLYFAAYAYWYFLKSSDSIIKLKTFAYQRLGVSSHNDSTIIDSAREMTTMKSPYKHDYLDNFISKGNFSLLDRKEDPDYPYPSFLHELYFNFEKGDWEKIAMWDQKRYCPTTLLLKKPKSKFCKETNTVVEGFNHYSYTLKRPVDKNIHPFYLLLLIQQTSLLFLYVFASILTFYNHRNSSILMIIPETLYLQTTRQGVLLGLYLLLAMIYLGYSAFFTAIELYCLMRNLTYNEFFNSHRYPYLYRPNPFASGPGQQLIKIFHNPYDKGVWKNICDYVSRVMH